MERAKGTTLLTGGVVRTMGDDGAVAQALLLRDGAVVGAGPAAELRAAAGTEATVIELDGAVVLPGLVDTHPHLLHFGTLTEPLVDLADATSHADIANRIATRARTTPAGEWVLATPVGEPHYFVRRSWRDLDEGCLPDRHALDAAAPDNPVWIQAWAPQTPNVTAFNSRGLERIGVDRNVPEQAGHCWVDKDDTGEPTGILRGSVNNYYNDHDSAFWQSILAKLPVLDPSAVFDGTLRAVRAANAGGVTTVYEGHAMGFDEIDAYRALHEQGALTVRVLLAPEAQPYGFPWMPPLTDEEFDANLRTALSMVDRADHSFRVDGVTAGGSGPCWPGMMVARHPYRGPYGDQIQPGWTIPLSRMARAIEFSAEHGLRLNLTAGSDGDHDDLLDLLEAEAAKRDLPAGWMLQHGIHLDAGQVERLARLRFDVTTSVGFCWGKGEMYVKRRGEDYLANVVPLRRLLDAGIAVGCGTDWGPRSCFEHMALAMTRELAGSERRNLGPAQHVSREEAVLMWTREAAKVLRWEGVGTLDPGAHADCIVVDRDPLTCAVEDLAGTEVLTTIVAGRTVHDDGTLARANEREEASA